MKIGHAQSVCNLLHEFAKSEKLCGKWDHLAMDKEYIAGVLSEEFKMHDFSPLVV